MASLSSAGWGLTVGPFPPRPVCLSGRPSTILSPVTETRPGKFLLTCRLMLVSFSPPSRPLGNGGGGAVRTTCGADGATTDTVCITKVRVSTAELGSKVLGTVAWDWRGLRAPRSVCPGAPARPPFRPPPRAGVRAGVLWGRGARRRRPQGPGGPDGPVLRAVSLKIHFSLAAVPVIGF